MKNIPFYIAKRYFFSKTNTNAVNILTTIAVIAILVATTALFVILSAFSGLEKMNLRFYSDVNPELRIKPAKGKIIPNISQITQTLDKDKRIVAYSKVIEEKVYLQYNDFEDIAYLKGVDENYTKVSRIDTAIIAGRYFNFDNEPELIASEGIGSRLQIYVNSDVPLKLIMPKPGTKLLKSQEEDFTNLEAYNAGIFFLNDQYDKYLFSPISLAQNLLEVDKKEAYFIEIKTDGKQSFDKLKSDLSKTIGKDYVIETRQDLDAAFLKVMNVENLITYLIFTLVIIIACFNLAGTIIILILDKKYEIQTMYSFGMRRKNIRQIFFYTGVIITASALVIGLIIASILGIIQQRYPFVYASPISPFPFEFSVQNYLIVIATVLSIGCSVSWLMSKQVK